MLTLVTDESLNFDIIFVMKSYNFRDEKLRVSPARNATDYHYHINKNLTLKDKKFSRRTLRTPRTWEFTRIMVIIYSTKSNG